MPDNETAKAAAHVAQAVLLLRRNGSPEALDLAHRLESFIPDIERLQEQPDPDEVLAE